jgi:hypothetical protein
MPTPVAKTKTPERWDRAGDTDISLCAEKFLICPTLAGALRGPNQVSKEFYLMSKDGFRTDLPLWGDQNLKSDYSTTKINVWLGPHADKCQATNMAALYQNLDTSKTAGNIAKQRRFDCVYAYKVG